MVEKEKARLVNGSRKNCSFTKCKNCKSMAPISVNLARELIEIMGEMMNFPEIVLEKEDDYRNYYFEVGYCMLCADRLSESDRAKKLKIDIK